MAPGPPRSSPKRRRRHVDRFGDRMPSLSIRFFTPILFFSRAREAMATTDTSMWHRVLRDPQLRELPYKIETNEHGQLVLGPHKPYHGYLRMRIGELLLRHVERPGRRAVEFAVETPKGVKVPDVVWLSDERWAQIPEDAEASPVMPELCVEVRVEDNTDAEMREKRQLYLEEGAQEVWVCDADRHFRFFDADGERDRSALAPDCPPTVASAE